MQKSQKYELAGAENFFFFFKKICSGFSLHVSIGIAFHTAFFKKICMTSHCSCCNLLLISHHSRLSFFMHFLVIKCVSPNYANPVISNELERGIFFTPALKKIDCSVIRIPIINTRTRIRSQLSQKEVSLLRSVCFCYYSKSVLSL